MLALSLLAGTALAVLAAQAPSSFEILAPSTVSDTVTTASLTFMQEAMPHGAADDTTTTLAATPEELAAVAGWYEGLWLPDWRRMNRSYFAWSAALRRGVGPRTEAIAQIEEALAKPPGAETIPAILAAREAGIDVEPRLFELAVAMADSWRERPVTEDWGPDVLLEMLDGKVPAEPREALPERLLQNMRHDDVAYNALNATELYYAGMQVDPARFVPPLHALWKKLDHEENPGAQQMVLVGSLILLRAQTTEPYFTEQRSDSRWSIASNFDRIATGRIASLPSREQNIAVSVAEHFALRNNGYSESWGDGIEDEAWANRRRAWSLLETYRPLPLDVLLRIAKDDNATSYEQRHALTIVLLRDPSRAHDRDFGKAFSYSIAHNWWYGPYRYSFLFQPNDADPTTMTTLTEEQIENLNSMFEEILCLPLESVAGRNFQAIAAIRPALVDAVVRGIEDPENSSGQAYLARFLVDVGAMDRADVIGDTLVAQFANDDVWCNASDAESMMGELAEAPVDALRVGFEYGVQQNDWQLIRHTADWLAVYDPGYNVARPAAIEFMASQLRSDDVEGNCAAATAYLNLCREEARSTLMTLRNSSDPQQALRAAQILDGEVEEQGETECGVDDASDVEPESEMEAEPEAGVKPVG